MIQDVGNVDLFELLETDSETQKASSIAHAGISYKNSGQPRLH